ncbi:MAG TPA: pyridoxal-phosphate dependent enzyme, partial [Tepidisphaeraceae bacterium]|nr:pyridoxal-phosphate dependent enzyme [Tepidisphaeraceae bacterium]
NLPLDQLFGAEFSLHAPAEYAARRDALIQAAIEQETRAGHRPYHFPVGGSVPLGSWGYIRLVAELLTQIPTNSLLDIYVAVSSSGTLAGLIVGCALLRASHIRVVGVPVSDSLELLRPDVSQLVAATVHKYDLGIDPAGLPIEMHTGFIGDGYAIPTPQGQDALRTVGRLEGIALDPTYTAKAMAGFLDAVKTGKIRSGATAMFIHTGGIFGLLARPTL